MKKGFVFIETVTVLMVLVTTLLSVFLSFQNVKANMDKREFYDNVSDIYKTDMIRKPGRQMRFKGLMHTRHILLRMIII